MTNEAQMALERSAAEGIISDLPNPLGDLCLVGEVHLTTVEETSTPVEEPPYEVFLDASRTEGYVEDLAA